ncbi:zinc-binding dehydrogenase [Streptomyces sp. NPDC005438]|uniref:alcohol dehydrogenase catalytic domain-containing protein n=1 Tax=Streptomyces sp. NPDC005438 TaxID=3156880 RepID=UPI0033A38128
MTGSPLPSSMRAVALTGVGGPEVLAVERRPVPRPEAGQFLVRVAACGVCGHDLLARRGALTAGVGTVLGHEIAGTVVALGPGTPPKWRDQPVALVQRLPCGDCPDCAAGRTTHCRRGPGFYGDDQPGGYAEYVLASPLNAVPLPEEVDPVEGALLSCAVGTGLRALRTAEVRPGEVVVVTGAGGGVGLHTVRTARHLGATVLAVTGSPSKAADLRAEGADAVLVAPDRAALREELRRLGRPRGAEVAVEVTGAPTFRTVLRALAPGGRLVLVGNTEPATLPLDPGLVIVKELRVLGSAHADRSDLERVVELARSGAVTPVAARRWTLEETAGAHRAVENREVTGRAVVVP